MQIDFIDTLFHSVQIGIKSQKSCMDDTSDERTRKRQSVNRPSDRSISVAFPRLFLHPWDVIIAKKSQPVFLGYIACGK